MILLNIFKTGGLTLGLTIVWGLLFTWFLVQAIKAHNSGTITPRTTTSPEQYSKDKIPLYKIAQFWGAIVVTALYVIALMLVYSDYKGA